MNTQHNTSLTAFIIFSIIICIILLFGRFFYYSIFFIIVVIIIYYFATKKGKENFSNNMDELEFKNIPETLDPAVFFQKIQNNDDFSMATPLYNPLELINYPSHFTPNYAESVLLGNITTLNQKKLKH